MFPPPIAVFAYSFPHQKTHDFLLEMAVDGFRDVSVIGAPWRELSATKGGVGVGGGNRTLTPKSTREIAASFGFPYIEVPHDDRDSIAEFQRRQGFELGIISGARIIKPNVISLFRAGIINLHPGKLPETSGLDAFFYSILKAQPFGVTAHFIDGRVDAGFRLFFQEVEVGPDDSVEALVRSNYLNQLAALRRVLRKIKVGDLTAEAIDRPTKNHPLEESMRKEALDRYPFWRAIRARDQATTRFFLACELGDTSAVQSALRVDPSFVRVRNGSGWTPLIVAAFNQQRDTVRVLLDFGADVNAIGNNGTSVFMYAKTRVLNRPDEDYGLLQLLVDRGADLSSTDSRGLSVLDYVRQAGDQRLANWIQSKRD